MKENVNFENPTTLAISNFIKEIGIDVIKNSFKEDTILPGIKVEYGKLIVDEEKLLYPGDLLHEAGHIAVKPAVERDTIYIDVGNDPAEEMMSLAWSYAAAVKLNISPEVVFHPYGYKGDSQILIDNFMGPMPIGLPMLQYVGMALDVKRAAESGMRPFPEMIKWLRD